MNKKSIKMEDWLLPRTSLPKIATEKIFHDKTQIKFLENMSFIYGSVDIKMKYYESDNIYKKDPTYVRKWKNQTKSFHDPRLNCMYVLTGEISNCFVIDIDDETLPIANKISNMSKKTCNLISETRRGKHFFFLYDEEIFECKQFKEYGFDIRSNGGLIFCPPGYYYDENNKLIQYKYSKKPDNLQLNKMTDELKTYLLNLCNHHQDTDSKKTKKIKSKSNNKKEEFLTPYVKSLLKNKESYILTLKEALKEGVENLDVNRNCCYTKWVELGMLLSKFGDYGVNLWKDFSKNYSDYDEDEINKKLITFSENDGLQFGSLYHWLKEDNKKYSKYYYIKYKELINFINIDFFEIEGIELDRLYVEEDRGYIKMYYAKFKDKLVCTSQESHTFLLYNKETQLYEFKTIKDIQNHFMDTMKIIIEPLVKYYKKKADKIRYNNKDKAKKYDKKILEILYTPEFYKACKSKHLMPLIESQFYNQKIMTKMDNNKELFPVKNGVINLKTGEFRKRTKDDYFSFELNVEWKGLDYNTDDIDNFFNDIMLNDKAMILYLQKLLGYSISGYINEQKFVIMWGNGGNGKGVLQNLLKKLLGKYYRQLTNDVVMETKKSLAGSASPHLMQLLGARLAFVDESEMGGKLNESTVKNITGGTAITARPLYGNPITFEPTFQLFLLTNHKPEINVNLSIERRLVLIPFLAEFKNENNYDQNNQKHRLGNKDIELNLLHKLDQLLVWLINGSVKYFDKGLGEVPIKIIDATKEYLNENDDLGNFLKETFDVDINSFVYHNDLFDKYKQQYNNSISAKLFTSLMKEKGYVSKRRKDGMMFNGLKLKKHNNFLDDK
jgi:P4 family phage/plasmid primase-like protien